MSRVFLYQKPRRRISTDQLQVFGDIVYLFDEGDPRASIFKTEALNRQIVERLEEQGYNPQEDFFCASGSLISIAICASLLGAVYQRYRVVAFSSSEDRYVSMWLGQNKETVE